MFLRTLAATRQTLAATWRLLPRIQTLVPDSPTEVFAKNFFLSLKHPLLRDEWSSGRKDGELQRGYECDPYHPTEYGRSEFYLFVQDRLLNEARSNQPK